MNRTTISILTLAALCAVSSGCRKKAPATAASAPAAPAVAAAAPPPTAPPTAAQPYDPWSASLDELNEYLRREGLLGTVFFDYDSAELSASARERLAANARFLQERPELVVAIEGHADERGTNEYNLALGDRRAGSARSMLQTLGVRGERLRTISYGEERPECTDAAESCWRLNRRAQFVVVGRGTVG